MAEWYYAQNNQQKGPVSAAELKQMAVSGELRPGDLVWREGMQDWTPAASTRGLFPDRSASGRETPGRDASGRDASGRGASAASEDVPRSRRREADDFDDYAPRRGRRGLSTGAKVGIIIGIVSGALVVAGVIVLVILLAGSGTSFTLRPNERRIEFIEFAANREAQITIHSDVTPPGADVDLFVFEGTRNFPVVQDIGPSKDCIVRFTPRQAQRFRIEIVNLGPGTATCSLSHNGTLRTR